MSVLSYEDTSYGVRITLPEDAPDSVVMEELQALPREFSKGKGVVVDLLSRECSFDFLSALLAELVWKRRLNVLSWNSYHADTIDCLKLAELPMGEKADMAKPEKLPTLMLNRSLRSGQKIEHNGDVVIFGHVNGGAEIVARGNITVFGKLTGLVHAGFCNKEDEAFIFASSFEPQQIRLGGLMNTKVGPQVRWWGHPVLIFSEKGSLIVREL